MLDRSACSAILAKEAWAKPAEAITSIAAATICSRRAVAIGEVTGMSKK